MVKEPMLAGEIEPHTLEKLKFHAFGSPKLDGIRAFSSDKVLYSRKLKPIPNAFVQETLGHPHLHGLDGELIVGAVNDDQVFNISSSGVMTRAGEPDFTWWVFDDYTLKGVGFEERIEKVKKRVADLRDEGFPVKAVPHKLLQNLDEFLAFEQKCLDMNLEGIMYRSLDGPYKEGRSTFREGHLLKFKRFVDAEAEIIGYEELLHNDNPAEVNELGRTKRSGHKANKRGGGTLGSLLCRTPEGVEFSIGGGKGLTAALRAELWAMRESLPGRFLKYSSFPVGVKDRPRLPKLVEIKAIGLRHPDDM
jgi:DNA ligase-1